MALPLKESFCLKCGRMYPLDKFFKSNNPNHHSGVLPYCKDCCAEMVKDRIKLYGNLESALWMTCADNGVPFVRKIYEKLEDELAKRNSKPTKTYNYLGNYLRLLAISGNANKRWKSFDDTDVAFGDIANIQKHEQSIRAEAEKFKLDWGYHEIEDYQFLEFRYDYYTDGLGELKPSQETLYRRLCLVELSIRKKDEEGLDTKEEQKQMIALMKTLGIDDFQNSKDLTMAEKIIESQIAWMEEEEPAFHYRDLEKYKDFRGIEDYWYNHVLRPLKNLLIGSKEYTLKETADAFVDLPEGSDSA